MYLRISHNAEFYAAGRLVRDEEGKQLRILSREELVELLSSLGGKAIVLVPSEHLAKLTGTQGISTDVLGNNDEFSITAVHLEN